MPDDNKPHATLLSEATKLHGEPERPELAPMSNWPLPRAASYTEPEPPKYSATTVSNEETPSGATEPRRSWLARNADAVREYGLGGLSFSCAISAPGSGGDMTLAIAVLFTGWVLGSVGLATASKKSVLWKIITILFLTVFFVTERRFSAMALARHSRLATASNRDKEGTNIRDVYIHATDFHTTDHGTAGAASKSENSLGDTARN